MKKKHILTSILSLFIGSLLIAQGGATLPPPMDPDTPPGLPIDGGIIALFFIALSYGIYKAYKISNKPV